MSDSGKSGTYTTGLPGLDNVLHGILPGDNLVWDVEYIEDYRSFVLPFAAAAAEKGKRTVYFRFAEHPPLLEQSASVDVVELDPERGFEHFVSDLMDVIEATAADAWYVFDCLSGLAKDWYADRMMANFFLVVCPYVLELKSLAFFAIYKHRHSNHATDTIYSTAQLILEVWVKNGKTYVQPQKVEGRMSATMYMLHAREGDSFTPITNSALTADVVASVKRPLLNFTIQRLGVWTETYRETETIMAALERGEPKESERDALFERLLRMCITRQTSFLPLARRFFDLPFLTDILKRLIGSGLIGGKARGILLANRILREADPSWERILEPHDSFFIGSDVFYTYVIQNDCWWLRRKKGSIDEILRRAAMARERLLKGKFLDYVVVQFQEMLEYFGQSPIIVRSSSLQEDSYGNAFSGKYESIFCANQGSPAERLEKFMDAVRRIYASSLSEEALLYRLHHGLLHEDEQMALLVQRVSGDQQGDWFFPSAAGVGFSYNPFAWDASIDPHSGMLRLAFGLGTRAVDRVDDDYTRIVALNAPLKRPDRHPEDSGKYIQRKVDVIDFTANEFATRNLKDALRRLDPVKRDLFASLDEDAAARARDLGMDESAALRLDFSRLFQRTSFCGRMRTMLATLEAAYEHPVDVEFTLNTIGGDSRDEDYRICLVQCRPFKVKIVGSGDLGVEPADIPEKRVFLRSDGPIVGRSLAAPIDRLIYVSPEAYTALGEQDRYAVARLVGRLAHPSGQKKDPVVMLVGPGRWGTSTPAMGIPVSFNDIKGVSVLVELAYMHAGLVPDVSLGTHFFNDLVEMDMLYFAVFPERNECCLSEGFLDAAKQSLVEIEPDEELWRKTVTVLESGRGSELRLYADSASQRVLCYLG